MRECWTHAEYERMLVKEGQMGHTGWKGIILGKKGCI